MENFDRIQRYILNEMSSEEHQLFEEEVRKSEDLAMELELQRFEVETVDQLEEDNLREKANLLKKKMAANKEEAIVRPLQNKRTNYRRLFLMSAVASIALLVGFFIFNPNEISSAEIIAMGYENARLDFGNRLNKSGVSAEQVFQSEYVNILKNRDQANVEEAITYFSNFSSGVDKYNTQALINLGHSYLLANQFNDALSIFTRLEQSTLAENTQIEEATFFKAMTLLGNGQESEAISILNKLAKEGSNYDALARSSLDLL